MTLFTIKNLKDVEDSAGERAPGVGGAGRIRIDDEVRAIGQWDVVRVSPQAIRAFEAGDDGLELIAVGADRPEGGDGVLAPSA